MLSSWPSKADLQYHLTCHGAGQRHNVSADVRQIKSAQRVFALSFKPARRWAAEIGDLRPGAGERHEWIDPAGWLPMPSEPTWPKPACRLATRLHPERSPGRWADMADWFRRLTSVVSVTFRHVPRRCVLRPRASGKFRLVACPPQGRPPPRRGGARWDGQGWLHAQREPSRRDD